MLVSLKVWKEDNEVIVRSDELHITTCGENLGEALQNFQEAILLNLEDIQKMRAPQQVKNLNIVIVPSVELFQEKMATEPQSAVF